METMAHTVTEVCIGGVLGLSTSGSGVCSRFGKVVCVMAPGGRGRLVMRRGRNRVLEKYRSRGVENVCRKRFGVGFVRADISSLDEKVIGVTSEEAVEDPEHVLRTAQTKAEQIEPNEAHLSALDLENKAEDRATEVQSAELEPVEDAEVRNVASASALEGPEEVYEVAAKGEMVEVLEGGAEDESESVVEELGSRPEDFEIRHEVGAWTDGERNMSHKEATDRVLEIVKDGIEAVKWGAEGAVSSGVNTREGFDVARELIDKRLKGFNEAAENAWQVSSKVAGFAKKSWAELVQRAEEFQPQATEITKDLQKKAEELKVKAEEVSASARAEIQKKATELQNRAEEWNSDSSPSGDSTDTKLGHELKENVVKLSSEASRATQEASKKSSDLANDLEQESGTEISVKPHPLSPPPDDESTGETSGDVIGETAKDSE